MAVCHWHPDKETGLSCGTCGKWICVECMRQHPVGIRCKECSQAARLPTYHVPTDYLLRALGATLGLGLAGGLGLFILDLVLGLTFFRFFIFLGLGYAIGEGLSAAVNRKRARPLQYMAGAGVLISIGLAYAMGDRLIFTSFFSLIGIGVAVTMASNRVRP
jgi:hypothetical protein